MRILKLDAWREIWDENINDLAPLTNPGVPLLTWRYSSSRETRHKGNDIIRDNIWGRRRFLWYSG